MIAFLALLEELKSGSAQVPPLPIPPPRGGRGAQDAAPGTSPPPRGEGMGVGGAAVDPWVRFLALAGPQEAAAAQRLMAGQRPRRVAGLDAILAWAAEAAVKATGARRVIAAHGHVQPIHRWLAEQGHEAGIVE